MSLYIHLRPANQREGHCFVLAHGHIFHQAAPERIVKFRNRLGQLFQFRDKSLEFPPADSALTDVDSHLFALRIGSLVTADRSIVDGVVIILVLCHPGVLGDQPLDRFRLRVQAFIQFMQALAQLVRSAVGLLHPVKGRRIHSLSR